MTHIQLRSIQSTFKEKQKREELKKQGKDNQKWNKEQNHPHQSMDDAINPSRNRDPPVTRHTLPTVVISRSNLKKTELYLEEITDRIEESEVTCQTDAWMDRPPTPLFVPAKTGADVSTQILPGDLFDFDRDVKVCIKQYACSILILLVSQSWKS